MAGDIAVREAASRELADIESLMQSAYGEFREFFPKTAWSAWMANISQTIRAGTGVLLVATVAGKILGAVKFYPDASEAGLGRWPPGVAAMRILAVHPDSRGRGLGNLLVRECLARARALQIPAIYLYTGTFMKAAQRLYERLGFHRVPEYDQSPGPLAYRLGLSERAEAGNGRPGALS